MLAIVLSVTPLSETASRLAAYTQTHGRIDFKVYGGRRRSHHFPSLLPLTLLDIPQQDADMRRMPVLSEASLAYLPTHSNDIYRQTIALFVAEIILNSLHHSMEDEALFELLRLTLIDIDAAEDVSNCHIRFMIALAQQLGIGISMEEHYDWYIMPVTRAERQQRLRDLTHYLSSHIDDFIPPKSLDVLIDLFD